MSIERLVDPWSRPHQLSDDLESFFWVLMYEVVRYRNDQLRYLPKAIREVFDQQSEPDEAGLIWGGDEKWMSLANHTLGQITIECLVQTPCSAIIEEMRSLFHDLNLHGESGRSFSKFRLAIEEARNRDPRVQCAHEKLQTSDAFLAILEKHLGSEWDIDDDASLELTDPGGIRRRKLEESDSEENIHIRRIGRMPPKSKSSSNWRSSQTSSAQCSDIPSSDPDSFMSTGSRDDDPPAKE